MRGPLVRYRSTGADSARWEGFAFREGDIVISTPPRCGTTWTQMICAQLIFQTPRLDRPLAEISPWLDMLTTERTALFAALEAQCHRRFIKTHTPLDGLPLDERVTYVCMGRDPRDAGLSWSGHMANFNHDAFLAARERAVGLEDLRARPAGVPRRSSPGTEIEEFRKWVDHTSPSGRSQFGLAALFHHIRSFWPARTGAPNLVLLHYDDFRADLEGQMRSLARRLTVDVPEEKWPELVAAARFEEMRRKADDLVPNRDEGLWHDNADFFRQGTSGQWRTRLGRDDLRRYHARVAELADPEVAAWLHRDLPVG
ncbi:sulfotransferase domain-containing protein [Streptomyces rectiverticillatus]|uniref:sulfotransferase domain-containing protein n=1 Tax=Streptomyces rectiverticillatus TaxID=173860 RepID=UPI0015C3E7A4|nr:sulfotransferase domain-containing protein [Streptomyces rectiverticillatus]QLE70301.1 sulfotransferase domain-containing protein [Streptomyces rectiverticillatus]